MATFIHKSISNMAVYTMRAPSQTTSTASVKSGMTGGHPIEKIRYEFENHKQYQATSPNDIIPIKRWFAELPVEEGWNHIGRTQHDLAALRVKVVRVKL
jgi:hypothetical protein